MSCGLVCIAGDWRHHIINRIDELDRDLNILQIVLMREINRFLRMTEIPGFKFAFGPTFVGANVKLCSHML